MNNIIFYYMIALVCYCWIDEFLLFRINDIDQIDLIEVIKKFIIFLLDYF